MPFIYNLHRKYGATASWPKTLLEEIAILMKQVYLCASFAIYVVFEIHVTISNLKQSLQMVSFQPFLKIVTTKSWLGRPLTTSPSFKLSALGYFGIVRKDVTDLKNQKFKRKLM